MRRRRPQQIRFGDIDFNLLKVLKEFLKTRLPWWLNQQAVYGGLHAQVL
jgi:hypothetical protein